MNMELVITTSSRPDRSVRVEFGPHGARRTGADDRRIRQGMDDQQVKLPG